MNNRKLIDLLYSRKQLRKFIREGSGEFQKIKTKTGYAINLNLLEEKGIVEINEKKFRKGVKRSYRLTEEGKKLKEILLEFEEGVEDIKT